MITDDALRAAAKEASLALAEALTQGSKQQPPYVPSKSFTCKMSRLCRRERHPVFLSDTAARCRCVSGAAPYRNRLAYD